MNKNSKLGDDPVDVRTAGLGNRYLNLVTKRQLAKERRDAAEAEIKSLNYDIIALQAESGYKTIVTPDWRVTLTSGTNTSISREKLLEKGVAVKVIEFATKRTTYETLTITAVKDAGAG